ncbi:TetR/AcrR family transcriptional regulator [Myxococcota bacterium]|nr:TetR/AcrR family transcriptional regulator [Myxococcota bacterium]MCZ7619857.1 TetR/AcrR family transcriptional regulator [Myxococcota bacterium]
MAAELEPLPAPPHDRTRDGILEAARRRFLRFGAPKTTMDEVAREAGCSRTTLYAHFRNKEDLYARLLEQDAEAFIREASGVLAADANAGQKIRRIVEITRRTYARNHVMRLALSGDTEMSLAPAARAFTSEQERRIVSLLREVLDQGVAEGSLRTIDTERVAYLMFHLGQVLVERETAGVADYPFDEIIELMDRVFAEGIAKPRPHGRKRR